MGKDEEQGVGHGRRDQNRSVWSQVKTCVSSPVPLMGGPLVLPCSGFLGVSQWDPDSTAERSPFKAKPGKNCLPNVPLGFLSLSLSLSLSVFSSLGIYTPVPRIL
jgi:hypothetical protein